MENNNLEKQVQQQTSDFGIQPRGNVWLRIESELDKKKKRRVIGWWWAAPIALLLAGSGYFLLNSTKNNTPTVSNDKLPVKKNANLLTQQNMPEANNSKALQPIVVDNNLQNNKTTNTITTNTIIENTSTNDHTRATNLVDYHKNNRTIIRPIQNHISINKIIDAVKNEENNVANKFIAAEKNQLNISNKTEFNTTDQLKTVKETIKINNNNDANNLIENAPKSSLIVKDEKPMAVEVGQDKNILNNTTEQTNKTAEKLNPVLNTALKSTLKLPKPKGNWKLITGVGSVNISESVLFTNIFETQKNLAYALPIGITQNSGNITPFSINSRSIYAADPGFSFTLGLQKTKSLSKTFKWNTSFVYQLSGIKQYSGVVKDSLLYLSNNISADLLANKYFLPGNSVTHRNFNHRLYITNSIALHFGKKRNWNIQTGLTTGFNIGNNYLVQKNGLGLIWNTKGNGNKFFAGFEAGIQFNYKNKFDLGFFGSTDITKSSKSFITPAQYWHGWQIKAGLPIKLPSLKKIKNK